MKYLIITSAGGGAHLMVARAQRDQLAESNPLAEIEIIDIMGVDESIAKNKGQPWVPSYGIPFTRVQFFSGESNVNKWDSSQKRGGLEGVRRLEQLVDYQSLAEAIQSHGIYQHLQQVLQDNPELEEIIDTQALSTPDICRAVSEENKRRKAAGITKLIKVRKIISEFLTDKTVHYLNPIHRIAKEHADCLTVEIVNSPLRPNYESEEAFFQRKEVDHVHFEIKDAPLRAEFLNPIYAEEHTVFIKTAGDDSIGGPLKERAFIHEMLEADSVPDGHYFKVKKQEHDKFFTISLGSQSSVTILRYIDAFIEQVTTSEIKSSQRIMFFVAAGKNDGTSNTMYAMARMHLEKRMAELQIAGIKWPDSAKIIPLSFQDDKSMASLFQNSDVLITRTGGMSSIEANETQKFNKQRKVYLHSEATPVFPDVFPKHHFDACYNALLPGTVRWEGGNAQYLMQSIDACLTSPATVKFNINNDVSVPRFHGSLVHMASQGTLEKSQFKGITECLHLGSDPNVLSFGDLPALAYAKDIETLQVCIKYGGKLTWAAQRHLTTIRHIVDDQEMKALLALEKKIQQQIVTYGAPKKMLDLCVMAIQNGEIDKVKGMISRFPKLIFAKVLIRGGHQSLEQIATAANQNEALWVIERAKGATPLHLALRHTTQVSEHTLKHMIHFNQHELNSQYPAGITPLTLCNDQTLRRFMVMLGANPYYLSDSVSSIERKQLVKKYQQYEKEAHLLKKFILHTYLQNAGDETQFCATLIRHLQSQWGDHDQNFYLKMVKSAFIELRSAEHDIERMTIIERLVDKIKYLFGADISSQRTQIQSRNLLFHQRTKDSSDAINEHNVHEENSELVL